MTLPILKRPSETDLTLDAHPYVDGSYWDEGLDIFHRAAFLYFTNGLYGEFALAEWLNVHRVISDEWLTGLVRTGRAERIVKPISAFVPDPAEAIGFQLKAPSGNGYYKVAVPAELRAYDPWTDRNFDADLPDALLADLYIDKFFMVNVDEHYIFRKKTRKRKDGVTFKPVSIKDMPRYENSTTTRLHEKIPAPDHWQARIAALAYE